MSELRTLVLDTNLYVDTAKDVLTLALDHEGVNMEKIEPETMTMSDWDRVLQLVLESDRCITL